MLHVRGVPGLRPVDGDEDDVLVVERRSGSAIPDTLVRSAKRLPEHATVADSGPGATHARPRSRRPRRNVHHSRRRWRDGEQCVDDNLALLVVTRALVASYPTWTDEHGTNVEQLAAIAVRGARRTHGLLARTSSSATRCPAPGPVPS